MMECPRCKTSLSNHTIKDVGISVDVEKCDSCEGIWFSKNELEQIEKIIEPVFFEIRKIHKKIDEMDDAIVCPSCSKNEYLLKAEHPRDNHIFIDYCRKCKGVWLDKGELDAIQKENWLKTVARIFKWVLT